jgi:hypothetical protein
MVLTKRSLRRPRRAHGRLSVAGHNIYVGASVSRGIWRMRHGHVPWRRRSRRRLALRLHH